ncbi:protein kinase [Haloferula sp. A504]|uniref:serine/threonine-protein kinase n=1 Tax=Haloferula sp. A504 TaxID=3373601 RepID=UPI0031CA2B82|nr:protein kinase [Verrucomicrobiaceae bacterium E54]
MTPSEPSHCPKCHSEIPGDSPGGLCPKCVLEGAAATPSATSTGHKAGSPPSVQEIAPHFPDLEVLERIGTGGMGAVYKARQPQLDRMVALKILSHDLAADPSFTERFNREAKVLARLSHPNIVGIHDYGTAGPYCYLLMELVDGVNLRQAMQAGRFSPAESLAMVEEICSALKFAHEEGILHRDIKPENVLIDSKGRVKIADFGIAKMVGEDDRPDVTLTLRGSVLGSPHYMAPEQIETPGDIDQRADIYSLGVVFYEMLTGELPLGRFAPPSQKAAMDARIDDIVLRTLEKERQARFQSAEEVMTQVGAVAERPRPPAAPAPDRDAGGTAGSLSSATLTGVSLAILIATAILTSGSIFSYKVTKVIGGIGLSLSAIVAIVGFILGCVALTGIRRSGGRTSGLGLAVFGTVGWLILMIPMVGSQFLMMPMPGSGGGISFGPWVLIVFLILPAFLAAFVLVRTLRRWAGGVPREDGGRDFPGMGRGLALVVLLALAGPILLLTIPRFLPEPEVGMSHAERQVEAVKRESERMMAAWEMNAVVESSGMNWHRGGPEVILPLKIHDSFRAEFRLALYDGKGNPKRYSQVGPWEPAQRRTRIRVEDFETCRLHIGTIIDSEEVHCGIAALVGSTGQSGFMVADTDFAEWNFNVPENQRLDVPLATAGTYEATIARLEEEVDGKTELNGVLRLEVRLLER